MPCPCKKNRDTSKAKLIKPEAINPLPKEIQEGLEDINKRPCDQCQGGGCPTCNGYGYIIQ